jgi:hypothetical protein
VGFEVAAAVQSGAQYVLFATPLRVGDTALATHHKALILVPVTVAVWVTVTLVTRPVDGLVLATFYTRVRPGGFWGPVARANPFVACDGLRWSLLVVWLLGSAGVFGVIFGLGKLVLGETGEALPLFGLGFAGALAVVWELRRPTQSAAAS